MSKPSVSVLMSVYNGERYLQEAVESVLQQTYTDYEFIIIDDGSKDRTWELLNAFNDPRIRLISNEENIGLTQSLNKGIQMSRGDYLARQDADDISTSERLAMQMRFLREHPEVGVLGTWVAYIDKQGQRIGTWATPGSPPLVSWSLLFGNCIAHPSVIVRRSLLRQGLTYRPEFPYAQDYDLWVRLNTKTQLANLTDVLYWRRVHEEMIGVKYSEQQDQTVRVVMQQAIKRVLAEEVSDSLIAKLWRSSRGQLLNSHGDVKAVASLVVALYRAFTSKLTLDKGELAEVKKDAVRRLQDLAVCHAEQFQASASRLLWQSIRLDRRLPVNAYFRMMRKFLGIWLRKSS